MDEPDWSRSTHRDDTMPEQARSVGERGMPDAFSMLTSPADGLGEAGLSEVWDYLGKH
jgi:hypothetical protein